MIVALFLRDENIDAPALDVLLHRSPQSVLEASPLTRQTKHDFAVAVIDGLHFKYHFMPSMLKGGSTVSGHAKRHRHHIHYTIVIDYDQRNKGDNWRPDLAHTCSISWALISYNMNGVIK